ncbi:MAG TPA: methylated-DNA--[protein]-cysteine S-methyltransferase [Lacibacter sp.]|nr:methylated-DNA--[protein]-cysteine S-methyltransferase [Lacibacter sp.]
MFKTEEKLVNALTHTVYYHSPIGAILLEAEDEQLIVVSFRDDITINETGTTTSAALQTTIKQLDEYFAGARKQFDLSLNPQGTAFQQKVWDQLIKIPYSETVTYLHMAKRLGNVKSIRAAASANGKNPIGIIIPCHRVVGADGKLTGYAGGLHRKQWLLDHEAKMAGKQSSLF